MSNQRIRPGQEGIRATLFDLEADIMEIVWASDWTWFAVTQVRIQLLGSRSIAYTTVMTTVARLFKKGVLERRRDGRRFLYHACHTRVGFVQRVADKVLGHVGEGGQDAAMALLVDRVSQADSEELERLEAMIAARREALKGG